MEATEPAAAASPAAVPARGGRSGGRGGGSQRGRGRSGTTRGGGSRGGGSQRPPAAAEASLPAESVEAAEARPARTPGRRLPGPDLNIKRIIKVSKESDVKKVAGSIAHIVRETNAAPVILASGAASVNQAVKALAVARKYLEQEETPIDLFAQPHFDGFSQRLTLTVRIEKTLLPNATAEDALTVKAESTPSKVAGAIAGRVRDQKSVNLITVGRDGVFGCLDAIAIARKYLMDDNTDLEFAPHFLHLSWDKKETNGLCLMLIPFPANYGQPAGNAA